MRGRWRAEHLNRSSQVYLPEATGRFHELVDRSMEIRVWHARVSLSGHDAAEFSRVQQDRRLGYAARERERERGREREREIARERERDRER